eukprot:gene4534-biopygen2554
MRCRWALTVSDGQPVGMKKYRREQKHLPVPTDVVGVLRSEKAEVLTLDDDFDSQGEENVPSSLPHHREDSARENRVLGLYSWIDGRGRVPGRFCSPHPCADNRSRQCISGCVRSKWPEQLPQGGREDKNCPRNEEAAQPPPGGTTREMGSRQDKTAEEQHTELEAAPASYLNEWQPGRRSGSLPTQLARVRPETSTRQRGSMGEHHPSGASAHIRCLRSLKNMPTELLNVNIASAVLECVRRDAKQRQWSPSTMAKEYAAMAGALRDLPLYTTESRGVYLSEFPGGGPPKTVKRLERETDTGGPAPITFTQYKKAVADLRRTSPKAALYLSMMWALAARAGDIGSLRAKDITLEMQPRQDGTHSLGIVQRFGKEPGFEGRTGPPPPWLQRRHPS